MSNESKPERIEPVKPKTDKDDPYPPKSGDVPMTARQWVQLQKSRPKRPPYSLT
jgi:hypothetical protein